MFDIFDLVFALGILGFLAIVYSSPAWLLEGTKALLKNFLKNEKLIYVLGLLISGGMATWVFVGLWFIGRVIGITIVPHPIWIPGLIMFVWIVWELLKAIGRGIAGIGRWLKAHRDFVVIVILLIVGAWYVYTHPGFVQGLKDFFTSETPVVVEEQIPMYEETEEGFVTTVAEGRFVDGSSYFTREKYEVSETDVAIMEGIIDFEEGYVADELLASRIYEEVEYCDGCYINKPAPKDAGTVRIKALGYIEHTTETAIGYEPFFSSEIYFQEVPSTTLTITKSWFPGNVHITGPDGLSVHVPFDNVAISMQLCEQEPALIQYDESGIPRFLENWKGDPIASVTLRVCGNTVDAYVVDPFYPIPFQIIDENWEGTKYNGWQRPLSWE